MEYCTSKKRGIIQTICILFATVFPLISLCSCVIIRRDYNEVFLKNWEITLPNNMKEEFRKSEDHWGYEGVRYASFKLEEVPSDFLKDFSVDKNKEIEEAVNQYLSEADFKIAKKFLPDWERNYYWKYVEKTSEEIYLDYCYMIYFTDTLSLKICQYFS